MIFLIKLLEKETFKYWAVCTRVGVGIRTAAANGKSEFPGFFDFFGPKCRCARRTGFNNVVYIAK